MDNFTAHEGQDTIVIRGSMHHTALSESEFNEWLSRENCTKGAFKVHGYGTESCLVRYADGNIRCVAMRIAAEFFEPVY